MFSVRKRWDCRAYLSIVGRSQASTKVKATGGAEASAEVESRRGTETRVAQASRIEPANPG
jgi:hypothetical protein